MASKKEEKGISYEVLDVIQIWLRVSCRRPLSIPFSQSSLEDPGEWDLPSQDGQDCKCSPIAEHLRERKELGWFFCLPRRQMNLYHLVNGWISPKFSLIAGLWPWLILVLASHLADPRVSMWNFDGTDALATHIHIAFGSISSSTPGV